MTQSTPCPEASAAPPCTSSSKDSPTSPKPTSAGGSMSATTVGVSQSAYNKLAALRKPFAEMDEAEQLAIVRAVREKRRPMTKAERAALAEQPEQEPR